ncbi:MAG: hypothetical protein ABSA76_13100 [Bacteroidales bacterium]
MLKKLNELDKDEKLLLLEGIASGVVDREAIDENTFFAFGYKDAFSGLQIVASQGNKGAKVVCLGEASKASEAILNMK